MNRNYALDVLKIVATMIILLHHYQQVTGAVFRYVNFWGGNFYYGYMVELFFMISGFLMLGYLKKIQCGYSFKEFIVKRIVRLLPLVAIAAVIYSCVDFIYYKVSQRWLFGKVLTFWGILSDMAGIQDGWVLPNPMVNNPTWYISVLLLCYIVFYILIWLSKKLKISSTYLFAFMVLLGMGIQTYGINLPFMNASSARGYYAFFAGVLLARFSYKYISVINKWIMGLIFIALCLVYAIYRLPSFMGGSYTLTFVLYPILIFITNSEILKKIFRYPFIGEMGKIAFNVYIWHPTIILCMMIVSTRFGLEFDYLSIWVSVGFIVITCIVSCISHYMIEENVSKWVRKKIVLKETVISK